MIRSCWADGLNHVGSVCQMNTGSILGGRPSLGAWTVYGLGSLNDNLPSYVVLTDREKMPLGGVRNWGTGFMPATYQGTLFQNGSTPIQNLVPPEGMTDSRQRKKLDMLAKLNRKHSKRMLSTTSLRPASMLTKWLIACNRRPLKQWISPRKAMPRNLYGLTRRN